MTKNPTFQKILVPTDFSDLSVEAIRYALSMANMYGSEILLLHVVDDSPVLAFHTMELTTDVVLEDTSTSAKVQLASFIKLHDINVTAGIRLLTRRGNPHEEITRCAEEEGADLIVMATHGRTGLAHVLLGSVAEKVLQHAHVPVMTVKPVSMR